MPFKRLALFFLDMLFPSRCIACTTHLSSENAPLCASCESTLSVGSGFTCSYCGRRFPTYTQPCHPNSGILLASALSFSNPLTRELIHALKYQHIQSAAFPLGRALASLAEKLESSAEIRLANCVWIPIPLHPRRLRERGFNQSELILKAFSAAWLMHASEHAPLHISTDTLRRTTHVPAQASLESRDARFRNMHNAFTATHSKDFHGKTVVLFDDVCTTGATLHAANTALRNAGARRVIAMTAARA